MEELHVVFHCLKVIRKLIDGSGVDQALEEAGKLIGKIDKMRLHNIETPCKNFISFSLYSQEIFKSLFEEVPPSHPFDHAITTKIFFSSRHHVINMVQFTIMPINLD